MITTEKVGRLPLRGTVLRSFGSSRYASRRFAPLPHIARDLLLVAFLFLIIFGLPGLFAGV